MTSTSRAPQSAESVPLPEFIVPSRSSTEIYSDMLPKGKKVSVLVSKDTVDLFCSSSIRLVRDLSVK